MLKLMRLRKNKTLKFIFAMLFAVVIVGITVSNEWIILAATILMFISVLVAYLRQK